MKINKLNSISIEEFKSLLKKKNYVLADFTADWCEPCKMLDTILKEVQAKIETDLFIKKIDVDASKEISENYQVMSVPVLILFKNGKQVWRMNGFLGVDDLLKILEKFLAH